MSEDSEATNESMGVNKMDEMSNSSSLSLNKFSFDDVGSRKSSMGEVGVEEQPKDRTDERFAAIEFSKDEHLIKRLHLDLYSSISFSAF